MKLNLGVHATAYTAFYPPQQSIVVHHAKDDYPPHDV